MLTTIATLATGLSLAASSVLFYSGPPAQNAISPITSSSQQELSSSFIDGSGSFESNAESLINNTTRGSDQETKNFLANIKERDIKSESGLELDTESAFVLNTEEGYSMLRVPFKGVDGILKESGVSYYFDSTENLVSTGEIVLTEKSPTSGTVELWQDGSKQVDQLVEDPQQNQSNNGVATVGFNWDTFNSCLSNAGIASWAIAAIGVACGAACAATAGLGCVVCATSTAGITGTTIGGCAGQAMA